MLENGSPYFFTQEIPHNVYSWYIKWRLNSILLLWIDSIKIIICIIIYIQLQNAVLYFTGYIVLFAACMYPLRAVKELWLLRGGQAVRVTTYAPFGKTHTVATSLNRVSCLQSRVESPTNIPMKIQGKWFFFLLDKRGDFYDTHLFDYSVGLYRNLKWNLFRHFSSWSKCVLHVKNLCDQYKHWKYTLMRIINWRSLNFCIG